MGKAVVALILTVLLGTACSFFNKGIGVVVAIGIMGAFIIYQLEHSKK